MASLNAPLPPHDAETKTIIDKLANFVARNGPEFEKMTMTKKREDLKFSFLFGGEHNPYYRWKVEMERVQMGVVSATPTILAPQYTTAPDPAALVESLQTVKLKELRDSSTHGLQDPLEREFVNVVKSVMDSCSKEAIASGKSWMFSHAHSPEECGRMAHYTMRRSLDCVGVEFSHKLHLVYLINDLLHHCIRKGASDLKQAMETVIVQIFYNIYSSHPKGVGELGKVVDIWESQEYLARTKLEQVRCILEYPAASLPPLEPPPPPPTVINTTTAPPTQLLAPPTTQPPPWQQTHPQGFANPAGNPWQQYNNWETPPPPAPPSNAPPPPWSHPPNPPAPWTAPPTEPTPLFAPSESIAPPTDTPINEPLKTDPVMVATETIDYNHRPPNIQVFDYQHRPAANWDMYRPPLPPPPPSNAPPPFFHDRPPPFFPTPPPYHRHDNLPPPPAPPPSIPYFDLPAGLMVPLVLLHETNYTSIKPQLVCLPPPQPPSERLLEAVEEFYYPPSEDKPRNEEGWEAKALLDFYNAKTRGHRMGRRNRRSRSRSYSPKRRRRSSSSSVSPPRRRRRSSRSPSSSSDSSDSSHSPCRRRGGRRGASPRSRSFSPSTPTIEDIDRRHKTRGPQSESLTEENVGHQLLKRMGWEGAGLGSREQGIREPIKGGEARDKSNQFAGVGVNMHDPFEQFRKNKSYTFNRRPPPGET